jgi:hypothetical protein
MRLAKRNTREDTFAVVQSAGTVGEAMEGWNPSQVKDTVFM